MKPLDEVAPASCADRLKVLADTTRLAVVELLMEKPRHVGDIMERLGVEQTLLSHHLRILREAGLVTAQREGKAVLYRLAAPLEKGRSSKALDLGCCQLSFDADSPRRKS